MLLDDYAHHPTEVKATMRQQELAGIEELLLYFNTFVTRTREFFREFSITRTADAVMITDIYPAREKPIQESSKLIYDILFQNERSLLFSS